MHPVGAGLCSAHTGAPNIPRRARERPAQSKTAENLPIPPLRISRISPLFQKRPAPVEKPGVSGRFRVLPLRLENVFALRHVSCLLFIYNIVN